MNAPTVLALLAVTFATAGTVLMVFEEPVGGWVMLGFAILGFLLVISMSISDARDRASELPPPRAGG